MEQKQQILMFIKQKKLQKYYIVVRKKVLKIFMKVYVKKMKMMKKKNGMSVQGVMMVCFWDAVFVK